MAVERQLPPATRKASADLNRARVGDRVGREHRSSDQEPRLSANPGPAIAIRNADCQYSCMTPCRYARTVLNPGHSWPISDQSRHRAQVSQVSSCDEGRNGKPGRPHLVTA